MERRQLIAALLLARALVGAAQCTTFGVPCSFPMTTVAGRQHMECRTTRSRPVPYCSAIGLALAWDYCTPCPGNCSKAVQPDTRSLCAAVNLADSTEVMSPPIIHPFTRDTNEGGMVPMPSRYAFYSHLQCLQDNCADMHSTLEPFHTFSQIYRNRTGLPLNFLCGGLLGAATNTQCNSSVADIRDVGSWLVDNLGNLTIGTLCRHTCHCGSCCNSTGPACPALPTAPTPALQEVTGGSSTAQAPGHLVLSVLVAAATVALSETP